MNFWRKFIKRFSHIARPLNDLLRKDTVFQWTPAHQTAFDELKHTITSGPVLRIPQPTLPFVLETDSSGFAISGILMQEHDSKLHPVGFHSASLNSAERNYPTHDQELLAIIRSLAHWRKHLEGTQHPILIRSDNAALSYFMKSHSLNRRQARWSEYLSRFDFRIEHIGGKKNRADGLSRRPDYYPEGIDNADQVLLPSSHFINAIIEFSSPVSLERFKFSDTLPFPSDIEAKLQDPTSRWTSINGVVRDAGEHLVVPRDVTLHNEIIHLTHSTPYAGHPGIEKIYELVSRNYVWNLLYTDVTQFIKSCPQCQQTKVIHSKPAGLLNPIPPITTPWEEITADLIVELPSSQGYDSMFVVVDRFTKRAHFIPTTSTISAEGTARLFRDNVWKHHGWPKKIISDRGPQFAAKFTQELNKLLGIETALSTAFHPQTDGQTERTNQELEQYLRLYTNFMQTDWSDWLASAEFAYNNCSHSSTDHSPFYLEYGRHPRTPLTIDTPDSYVPASQDFFTTLANARDAAFCALQHTAENMKRYADRKRKKAPLLSPGQKVWLDMVNLKTGRPSKKLDVRRTGPFEILRQINPVAYELRLPPSWRIHPVFHVSLIHPATIDESLHPVIVDDTLRPPPDLIDDQEEYEVESILDHKHGKRRRQYLVKWKGYPLSETSWQSRSDLRHARDVVLAYEASLT